MGAFSNTFSMGLSAQGIFSEQIPDGIYFTSLEDEFLTDSEDENILFTEI